MRIQRLVQAYISTVDLITRPMFEAFGRWVFLPMIAIFGISCGFPEYRQTHMPIAMDFIMLILNIIAFMAWNNKYLDE